ncbi:MAG: vitamin K epoxide reductase family protein [Patescibacteria group bacterium]
METTLQIIKVCAVIGILDTLYLIYHKMRGTEVACWFFPKEWCRKVQHSPYSKTFGIPNSVAGLGIYTLLLVLSGLVASGTASFTTIQAVVVFGFVFSLYFVYVQAFVIRAFCTWCVVSALNFLVLFAAVFGFLS